MRFIGPWVLLAFTWPHLLPVASHGQGSGQLPSARNGGGLRQPRSLPAPICFPPVPPPLDQPVSRIQPPGTGGRFTTPEELGAYVNEPFYPQLSTRLLTKSLTPKQASALADYRKRKVALQAALRAELERVRPLEPAERRKALQAFAATQAGALAKLEHDAEALRRDLIATDRGWNDLREWRLDDDARRGFSPRELAQVMRGYAFYNPHLLPAQRRLLLEIMIELLLAGENPEQAAARQTHAFFQPELARVQWPEPSSPALATRIAAYQSTKARLKKELYDAVHKDDGARLGFLTSRLRSLDQRQKDRLKELETLAEQIREEMAALPPPPPSSERPPLPPGLSGRVATLVRDLAEAERVATVKVERLIKKRTDPPVQVRYRFEPDGLRFVVVPAVSRRQQQKTAAGTGDEVAELRERLNEVADEYGRRLADLTNALDEIRREAGTLLGTNDASRITRAITATSRLAALQETQEAQRDYRVAVFEPGLSPEQRRLLFDAAIEDMGLPLPRPEMQPIERDPAW